MFYSFGLEEFFSKLESNFGIEFFTREDVYVSRSPDVRKMAGNGTGFY